MNAFAEQQDCQSMKETEVQYGVANPVFARNFPGGQVS